VPALVAGVGGDLVVGVERRSVGPDAVGLVADAVSRLPMLDRRVFMLRFRDELTQSEIADQVGVSQMQVSRILRRVTEQLRWWMDPGGAPASPTKRARTRRG